MREIGLLLSDIPGRNITRTRSCWTRSRKRSKLADSVGSAQNPIARRTALQRGFYLTVGTVENYKTEAHALKAAEGMRLMINDGILRREPVLFFGILDRFLIDQKQEEDAEKITHDTLACYRSMICQHIRPKWGDSHLEEVRPALAQDWLREHGLLPKYKEHIRSLMYRLFYKAMLWELLTAERNPMDLVEVKGITSARNVLASFR
jgi:hypothetical protein